MDKNKERLKATAAGLEAEIAELEKLMVDLGLVLGEFDHEIRRSDDALERVGGHAPEVETRRKALQRNESLTKNDILRTERQLASLRQRRADIDSEVARLD